MVALLMQQTEAMNKQLDTLTSLPYSLTTAGGRREGFIIFTGTFV